MDCDIACTEGCRREGYVCNLCYDTLCDNCTDYTLEGCTTCKPHSVFTVDDICDCIDGYYYNPENEDCRLCFSSCDLCDERYNGDCQSCMTGFHLIPDTGLCISTCPFGYTDVNGECYLSDAESI